MFTSRTYPAPEAPTVVAAVPADPAAEVAAELARRMAGPQRHRLLQGYPMLPLMRSVDDVAVDVERFPVDRARGLIVGVLPHTFCNPQVRGCGFCTFPHEAYRGAAAREVTARVADEVRARTSRVPGLAGRAVDALYVGGGTANLTPPDALEHLFGALAAAFDLTHAEVTLEGVPAYFLSRGGASLDVLDRALPARHRRLSMGVQTFDRATLRRMGRTHFGDRAVIAEVVERAHARGWTVSCDLLINLPGQDLEAMLRDVRAAVSLGFDQVCVYHLVLHEGLGTAWARDLDMLEALPHADRALASWAAVREDLLGSGFVQATLTNFERADVHASPRRFVYEECSFRPERYDGVGFGPSGISCFTDLEHRTALKVVNAPSAATYQEAMNDGEEAYDLAFAYDETDLRLLHLTRQLARLAADRVSYAATFGADLVDDHAPAITALRAAGLVDVDANALRLTPRGMFHADSVAGLLAWRRVEALRRAQGRRHRLPRWPLDDAAPQFMG